VDSKSTGQLLAQPLNPVTQNALSSCPGRKTTSNQVMAPTSAYTSMSVMPVKLFPLNNMALIPAPSVVMLTMVQMSAPEIDLVNTLYIHTMPYIAQAWHDALSQPKLLSSFPNLPHDIQYGSQIGNPPPLSKIFLLKNLSSANLHPEIIDNELLAEVAAGHMSGPFSIVQASIIFGDPFHSSPASLVEQVLGDNVWHMICHLSKTDVDGF